MAAIPTRRQGEYLTFIHLYIKLNRRAPSEAEFQQHFGVTPPTVHQMILALEKRGLIARTPGTARSIRLLISPDQLPRPEPVGDAKPDRGRVLGDWRITSMEMWDQGFVDAEVQGFIRRPRRRRRVSIRLCPRPD